MPASATKPAPSSPAPPLSTLRRPKNPNWRGSAMSEETAAAPESADPVAISLSLAGASRDEADAFLRDQRHHLHEQLKQIHLDIWEKWLGVLLRVATLCVCVAVACFLGAAVWNPAHDDGLVIEAFSVPPDLAARGLMGEV